MKKILLALLLVGCGGNNNFTRCEEGCPKGDTGNNGQTGPQGIQGVTGANGSNGKDATSCTVISVNTDTESGAQITCPDGTTAFIKNGTNGIDGSAGVKGSTGAAGADGNQGPLGPVGPQGVAGTDGTNGSNGTNGTNGTNGSSCTVVYTAVGATFNCPDGTSVNILNGVNGQDGSSVQAVKLCTDSSAGYPEYGFIIGTGVYAVYYGYLNSAGNPSDSTNGVLQAFMSKLTPGNYMSTNGTGCTFSIDANGTITH